MPWWSCCSKRMAQLMNALPAFSSGRIQEDGRQREQRREGDGCVDYHSENHDMNCWISHDCRGYSDDQGECCNGDQQEVAPTIIRGRNESSCRAAMETQ